jgi:nucleoside-diphosphate-sugar epimerase
MRVFVTGASGWIGSAVVPELLDAGHEVVGLARSEASAQAIRAAGAKVHWGSLIDPETLRTGAASADGVLHLAFIHDFTAFESSIVVDQVAVETMGAALEGTDRPFLIASGLLGLAPDREAVESDMPDPASPRAAAAQTVLSLADRGVRSSVVRLPPSVHGQGDNGFVPTVIGIARERGVSAYVGEGANEWPAVHRRDAARLFRLGLEHAPAGSVLHAVGDRGVPTRTIAEIIGRHLDLPVASVPSEAAGEHFGWMGRFFSLGGTASAERTQSQLGWRPTEPGLVEDLEKGHYFD